MDAVEITRRFKYHAPGEQTKATHEEVRSACWDLAADLNGMLPESREKSTAITKLEEVMFWANAAVARND